MKAGIITFHRAVNIGAILQTFALYDYVSKNVCDVEVIDYAPNNLLVPKSRIVGVAKKNAKILLHMIDRNSIVRQRKFDYFRDKHIVMSNKTYRGDAEIFTNPPQYDLLISGSDQIFNTTLSGDSKAYYLGFGVNSRKISYASSFGRSQLSELELNCIREELPKFEAISCRERQGKTIIEHEIGKECDIVVDPVFLLTKDEWRQVCSSPNTHKQEYIFVYVMEVSKTVIDVVEAAKKQYDLPVIVVYGGSDKAGIGGVPDFCCGPEDFIKYIDNARIVITNSFHGAAFSIIFNKTLITIAHSTKNVRLEHLFSQAGIDDKLISEWKDENICDYLVGESVYERFNPLIDHSKNYLLGFSDLNRKTIKSRPAVYTVPESCTGCSACSAICPVNAITMVRDKKGFLYPEVSDKCIHCNMCINTCQIQSAGHLKHPVPISCYGFKAEDHFRLTSSSGAFYTRLASIFIKQDNSIVIAAKYNDLFSVEHIAYSSSEGINETRGSKYVQSDFSNVYRLVTKAILDNKTTMIVGTPCQIAGLRLYLERKKISEDRLLYVDIVCHGASSPDTWQKYINLITNEYGSIKYITLRDKTQGWRGYHAAVTIEDGRTIKNCKYTSLYPALLTFDLLLRPSCFQCQYSSLSRCGDITIGDFWELANTDEDYVDNLGISMILPNSEKGKLWVKKLSKEEDVEYHQYPVSILAQHNLFSPTERGFGYDSFWKLYDIFGLIGACRLMGIYGLLQGGYLFSKRAVRKIKRYICL